VLASGRQAASLAQPSLCVGRVRGSASGGEAARLADVSAPASASAIALAEGSCRRRLCTTEEKAMTERWRVYPIGEDDSDPI
jgi:hypothetical protein